MKGVQGWSPNSKFTALNDNAGSNIASVLLFKVADVQRPLDLGQRLYESLKPSINLHSLTGNDHIYYNVRKWINPRKLELSVTGYGNSSDPDGFAPLYEYDVVQGTFHCIKRFGSFRSDLLFIESDEHKPLQVRDSMNTTYVNAHA